MKHPEALLHSIRELIGGGATLADMQAASPGGLHTNVELSVRNAANAAAALAHTLANPVAHAPMLVAVARCVAAAISAVLGPEAATAIGYMGNQIADA
ncbi:hypothetical protein HV824_05540 [Myxococcus sp. AM009]|uniref:hypothetical protein n=1 Tax=Myxococcus sp. AM009 TaxID=2745137 RepID=UPI0015954FD1|nr:hypothetical protein [Myxococcus sp. AM009]NVI97580.1 hypothetical protein [Myxococcus sp. AM009]